MQASSWDWLKPEPITELIHYPVIHKPDCSNLFVSLCTYKFSRGHLSNLPVRYCSRRRRARWVPRRRRSTTSSWRSSWRWPWRRCRAPEGKRMRPRRGRPSETGRCRGASRGTRSAKRYMVSVARLQNLVPSFPWIVSGWGRGGAIQGKEGI